MSFFARKPKRRQPNRGRKFRSPIEALESRRLLAADVALMGNVVLESQANAAEAPADHTAEICGNGGHDITETIEGDLPSVVSTNICGPGGSDLYGRDEAIPRAASPLTAIADGTSNTLPGFSCDIEYIEFPLFLRNVIADDSTPDIDDDNSGRLSYLEFPNITFSIPNVPTFTTGPFTAD